MPRTAGDGRLVLEFRRQCAARANNGVTALRGGLLALEASVRCLSYCGLLLRCFLSFFSCVCVLWLNDDKQSVHFWEAFMGSSVVLFSYFPLVAVNHCYCCLLVLSTIIVFVNRCCFCQRLSLLATIVVAINHYCCCIIVVDH